MRYREPLTIPIRLERAGARCPLHEQIAEQVGTAVDQGRLARGVRLPSTRTLARALGVTRGVTSAAYAALLSRGYLEARPGSGTYIAARAAVTDPTPRRPGRPTASGRTRAVDLVPSPAGAELSAGAAWRQAWSEAARAPGPARTAPLGVPELRTALIDHIGRTIGGVPASHTVVVAGGAAPALRFVLAALELRAAEVAAEDPAQAPLAGFEPLGLPVDEEGPDVAAAPPGCRAVVIAPDGQVPLARVMSTARRQAAAVWARDTGGYLVGLQSPLPPRPDAVPVPGLLAAGAPERSVLVGAVCDHPALRLGYAVVPLAVAARMGGLLREWGAMPPYVAQLVAARLLRDGTIGRLLRRLREHYDRQRRLLSAAFAPLGARFRLGDGTVAGAAPLFLPDALDADAVAGAARHHGVRVRTLASYHWSGRPAPAALVIGYGHLPAEPLRRGLATLAGVLRAAG